ncbi:MAG: hypothetical protein WC343_15705 [Bacilli bacterium]|jgi:hypothetical protein
MNIENTEVKRILSFEDVKNSEIDIFGNKFEVNFSEEYIKRLKEIDISKANDDEVFSKLKTMLNLILNDEKAYEKTENTYKEHEKKEFGTQVFIKVMTFIFNEYGKEIAKIKGIDFGSKNLEANRSQRRDNGYRKYNNRGYRRY